MLAIAGCQNKELDVPTFGGSRVIKPVVSSVAGTKSGAEEFLGEQIAVIPISESPDDSLFLLVYEKDMPDYLCDGAATKGSEVSNANLEFFYMKAYAEDDWHDNATGDSYTAGEYFDTEVVLDSGDWDTVDEYYWLNDVPLSFWSWNSKEPVVDPAEGYDKATFSYTLVSNVMNQEDLIFAYNGENRTFNNAGTITARTSTNSNYTRTDNEVDIRFYHALSAIRFDISGVEDNQSVDKITIGGVASGGDCTITIQDDGTPKFDWDNLGTAKSYSQTFESTDFDSTTGRQIAGSNKEFFMIPQALTDDATLTVTFDGTESSPKGIKAGGVEWEAGKYYTYKLSKSAYTWDYTFSARWNSYEFSSNETSTRSNTNTITSEKVRSDGNVTKRVNWTIKSYKIGSGSEVSLGATELSYDPSWVNVVCTPSSYSSNLKVTGKAAMIAKGENDYWTNKDGRTDDLEWSPEDWSDYGSIDLSKLDVYGDDIDATHDMTTSNCYIVRHAGTYMLPLVYGNAMQGGTEVEHTYCTEDITGGTNRLERFVNHRNVGIQSGFIENNEGCIATGCGILWQSDAEVVTGLEFVGDTPTSVGGFTDTNVRYLKFTVAQSTIEQSNALIAIKDSEGDVIWSWHIWVTNNPEVAHSPIKVTNYYGNEYYFLAVDNIGTVSSSNPVDHPDIQVTLEQEESGNTIVLTLTQKRFESKTSSLMYEWGRKDPFLKDDKDYDGNTVLEFKLDPDSNLASGILEPATWFLYSSSPYYEWATSPTDPNMKTNLWTGIKGEYGASERDGDTIKTIYDPSPVGYMVPPIGAFSGFDTYGEEHAYGDDKATWNVVNTSFDNGYVFYTSLGANHTVNTSGSTIVFHADGIRTGGNAGFTSNRGWYHSSSLAHTGSSCASVFMVESSYVSAFNTAAASNGYAIRPIKE